MSWWLIVLTVHVCLVAICHAIIYFKIQPRVSGKYVVLNWGFCVSGLYVGSVFAPGLTIFTCLGTAFSEGGCEVHPDFILEQQEYELEMAKYNAKQNSVVESPKPVVEEKQESYPFMFLDLSE